MNASYEFAGSIASVYNLVPHSLLCDTLLSRLFHDKEKVHKEFIETATISKFTLDKLYGMIENDVHIQLRNLDRPFIEEH